MDVLTARFKQWVSFISVSVIYSSSLMLLIEKIISCPYCGESITVLIDDSVAQQEYYEDCSVCCRPIRLQQTITFEGECDLRVLRDDE